MLSDDDIVHVRRGWAAAATDPDRTGAAFYSHLFRIAPDTCALFRNDMSVQGRKLAETLDVIVDSLDAPETLLTTARDLARRHVAYGVRPEHYDAVGAALVATLTDLLGGALGAAEKAAWERVYAALSGAMISAAYPPPADPAAGAPTAEADTRR